MPNEMEGKVEASVDADAAKQPPDPPLPPAVEVSNNGEGDTNKHQCHYIEKPEKNKSNIRKNIEVGCAVALVFITSFYTYYARKQARSSETAANAAADAVKVAGNTLGETQRSNARQERLADENRASSEADSEKAIKATQDAMRLDQRAWVGMQSIQIAKELNKPIVIRVNVANTGKTPAFKYRGQITAEVVPKGQRSIPKYSRTETYNPIDVLIPGEPSGLTLGSKSPPLDQTAINAIDQGMLEVYVYGRLCYEDAFKQPHWTRFCSRYRPEYGDFEGCDSYNETDNGNNANRETCATPN